MGSHPDHGWLNFASTVYMIASWLILGFGSLGVLVMLGFSLLGALALLQLSTGAFLMALGYTLMMGLLLAACVFLGWLTMLVFSKIMKLLIRLDQK